jgi:hypothetical protein
VQSHEEIRAAAAVLTDDRIADMTRGFVSTEVAINLMAKPQRKS